jgi:hypothetical protein
MGKSAKATETKESGLVLKDAFSIPDVLKAIDAKLKSSDDISDSKFRTSGNLEGFPSNLKDEKSIETLIRAMASVTIREDSYKAAAVALELDTFPVFKLGGCSSEDWKKDIQFRIYVINNKDRIAELQALKAEASKFVSVDDQKAMFYEKLNGLLGNK